jgi:hypothetical protein
VQAGPMYEQLLQFDGMQTDVHGQKFPGQLQVGPQKLLHAAPQPCAPLLWQAVMHPPPLAPPREC